MSEEVIKPEESKLTKTQRIERDRDRLLESLSAGVTDGITERVAWVLNHYVKARSSDVTCQLRYWQHFEPEYSGVISPEDLYTLTRLTSISRARARIQNEFKLFQGNEDARRRRIQLSEAERQRAIEEKPDRSGISIYADETGKNEVNVSVASVWVLDDIGSLGLVRAIPDLKRKYDFRKEIHFKDITRYTLSFYLELVDVLFAYSGMLSFKAITVPSAGNRDLNVTLEKLFYLLLTLGMSHEVANSRVILPKAVSFMKDEESEGSDKLMCASLKQQFTDHCVAQYAGGVDVETFRSGNSEKILLLQVADIFAGSVNRLVNGHMEKDNPKTDVAERLLEAFKVDRAPQDDTVYWGRL